MINSNEREVNTNNKENSERYVSLKSSSYFNSDRQQNFNSNSNFDNSISASNSLRNTPAAFMKNFQEAQMMSALKKSSKNACKTPSSKPLTDDQLYYAAVAKNQNEIIRDRIANGYSRNFTKQLAGYYVPPVSEMGLRSETLNTVASQLFLAAIPKGKSLRSNWGKGVLQTIGSKLLSLDEPYIEGNRDFLGFIRIDTDRVWDSPEQCQEFFRDKVRDGKIACEPHFLTGLKLSNGQFIRPHAIWLLNPESSVFNQTDNPGFRRAPVDKFKSVYFGLCHALLDAGADAGAPAMSQQVKNPLSPEWFTIPTQDSHFPDLSEHAEYLEMNHNRDSLTRQSASVQSGFDISQSNAIFNYLQKAAYSIMTSWHFNADPDFARCRNECRIGSIADRLHIELERVIAQSDIKPSKKEGNVSCLIATVAQYAAGSFDPDKITKKSNRGAALHLVDGIQSVRERKAIGGIYAAEKNADRVLKAIKDAVIRTHDQGLEMTKSAIAKVSGISRPSVHKYWSVVMGLLANYIVSSTCKKQSMIKRYKTIRTCINSKNTNAMTDIDNKQYLESYKPVAGTVNNYETGIGLRERVRNSYSEMRMKC